MEYTLIRSKRRTLAVEITRDGRVVVRAPQRMAQTVIDTFLASRADWIATHLQRRQQHLESHPPLTDGFRRCLRRQRRIMTGIGC